MGRESVRTYNLSAWQLKQALCRYLEGVAESGGTLTDIRFVWNGPELVNVQCDVKDKPPSFEPPQPGG
jgi:hypothetical protein